MANTKVTTRVIADDAITSDKLASGLTLSGVTTASGNITAQGNITLSSNSNVIATRSLLARDVNGLNIGTTGATTALSIDNSANVTMPHSLTVSGTLTAALTGSLASATTATTQSASDNSTKVATTAYVTTAIANLVDSAPSALDTLNELAAALGDDANFSTTVTNSIATKAALAGATFTGNVNINKETPVMRVTDTSSSRYLMVFADDNNSVLRASGQMLLQIGSQSAITIDTSRNATFAGGVTTDNITSGPILINSNSSAFGGSSVQGFNTDFLVDTGQGYARHNSYHTGGSNHQFLVNNTSSTSNDIAMAIAKDKTVTIYGNLKTSDIIARSSGGLALQTDEGTKRIFINDNGNVAIGTASLANAPLHVAADTGNSVTAVMRLRGSNSTARVTRLQFEDYSGAIADGLIDFVIPTAGSTTGAYLGLGYNSSTQLKLNNGSSEFSGNLGINESSPFASLHVGGSGTSVNSTQDISRTAIFRTEGTGNGASRSHAATFMRSNNAATSDQVGVSFVFDDGGYSATAEVMALLEDSSTAYSSLLFKTWRGGMATRQTITSDGMVLKPYQSAFDAVKSSTQTISVNDKVVFNSTYLNTGSDYNATTGIYTAPYSGFYVFAYTVLLQNVTDDINFDHYLGTSNRNYIGGMPGRVRYLDDAGTGWGDGYIAVGHTQMTYMDANDTAYVYFSAMTNSSGNSVTSTVYASTSNNWTKFSGYFLG